ncbi:hypothetical protein BDK92_4344 [Micromonospora pisi]|uniref:Uncharacterized protein n=1 Tax=Micromonospora pisi TaxID=589240 RepID=A0A495JLP7_9ACTN|nr:hypothetical protein [Micromonospora pisi]RKR89980.1 hypothetical protein BDK92_4344 [Micromonospora pisi]
MTGPATDSGTSETILAVRATSHRLRTLGAAAPDRMWHEADGWTRLTTSTAGADDVAAPEPAGISVAARVPACLITVDDGGLRLTACGPDGVAVGPLDAGCTEADAASAVTLFGLPDGTGLLHRALSSPSPAYDRPARLADVCRCLGMPLELLTPAGSDGAVVVARPAGGPEAGVVLVYAPAVVAAAEAPLTRQSAWTVPVDGLRSLHLWDGRGPRANLTVAAEVLADRRWPTITYWWSERTAGFMLTRRKRVVGAHEWGGDAPVTPEGTARAGRQLAEQFGVAEQALTVIGLLRRTDLPPKQALVELGELLDLPVEMVGRTAGELAEWAGSVPGAIRTERLSLAGAVIHSVREHRMKSPPEDLYHARPMWQRLLSGLTLLVFVPMTVFFAASWLRGEGSGWWVLLGLVLTLDMAWGVRPGRRSRMRVNRGVTSPGDPDRHP